MKTKKYDMYGGDGTGRFFSGVKKRLGKAVKGTAKILNPRRFGQRYKIANGVNQKHQPKTRYKAIAEVLRIPLSAAYYSPLVQGTKLLGYGAYRLGRRIKRSKLLTVTRSGKAEKELRQAVRITNLNAIKKKAADIDEKKQRYSTKIALLEKQISEGTDMKKKKGAFKRFFTRKQSNFNEVRPSKHLAEKLQRTKDKLDDVTAREKERVRKWQKKLANTQHKTNFKLNGTETLSNAIKKAKTYYAEEAKKKKQEFLTDVMNKKKEYDAIMQPFKDSQNKYIEAKKLVTNLKNEEIRLKETDTKLMSSIDKKAHEAKKTKLSNDIISAKKAENESMIEYKTSVNKLNEGRSKHVIGNYRRSKEAYKKISGKAQTLENLSKRSKERLYHSFARALKIPNIGYYMNRKITFKGNILKRSNKNSNSNNVKKDKKWLVKHWSNETSDRPNKLKNYITRGQAFLETQSTVKQKRLNPDGTPVIDPITKKEVFDNKTLEDIVKGGLEQGETIEKLGYETFLTRINKLEEEGKISPKQYNVLQKYHKALRIGEMIKNSNTTRLTKDIDTEIKTLDEVQKRLGNYDVTTVTKQRLPSDLNVGFGPKPDEISEVKLLTLFSHEVNKKKIQLNLDIDALNKLPDTDKTRSIKIAEFYRDNKIKIQGNPPAEGIIPKLSESDIIDLVKEDNIFSYSDVQSKLTKILSDPNSPIKKLEELDTYLNNKKTEEALVFYRDDNEIKAERPFLDHIKKQLDSQVVILQTSAAQKRKAAHIIERALEEERYILEEKLLSGKMSDNEIMQLKDLGLLELDGAGNLKNGKATLITDTKKLVEHIKKTNPDVKNILEEAKLTSDDFKTPEDITKMKEITLTEYKQNHELLVNATTELKDQEPKLKALPEYQKFEKDFAIEQQKIEDNYKQRSKTVIENEYNKNRDDKKANDLIIKQGITNQLISNNVKEYFEDPKITSDEVKNYVKYHQKTFDALKERNKKANEAIALADLNKQTRNPVDLQTIDELNCYKALFKNVKIKEDNEKLSNEFNDFESNKKTEIDTIRNTLYQKEMDNSPEMKELGTNVSRLQDIINKISGDQEKLVDDTILINNALFNNPITPPQPPPIIPREKKPIKPNDNDFI